MKRKYINVMAGLGIALCALFITSACSDKWDEHYDIDTNVTTDKTLWEVINSNSKLSDFAAVLKSTGYDEILGKNRVYTVWAPENGTFNVDSLKAVISAGGKDEVITEFIENHVADYLYSASGTLDKKIEMLNEKIVAFTGTTGNYKFQNISLSSTNKPAKNGLIHTLSHEATYAANLWEYLAKNSDLDSIMTYLYSFNEVDFDENASVQGPIVDGKITYLDSVIVNSNRWFRTLGKLNDEDSSYLMFAPTNAVWAETLERAKTYYRYATSKSASTQHYRDSLTNFYSKYAIIRNLVFTNNIEVQPSPGDSLISTTYERFYKDSYQKTNSLDSLYKNCRPAVALSNGTMYVAEKFNYRSITNWHDTIKVEAENSTYYKYSSCAVDTRRVTTSNRNDTLQGMVSYNSYIECSPLTTTGSPQVTFTLPNTLSASYNVKCVFVPINMTSNSTLASAIMPSKVRFQLKHSTETGGVATGINVSGVVTNPYKIDTVLVGTITFPVCEYGFETSAISTELVVMTNVGRTEKDFDRTLRLDCILLEPVEDYKMPIEGDE